MGKCIAKKPRNWKPSLPDRGVVTASYPPVQGRRVMNEGMAGQRRTCFRHSGGAGCDLNQQESVKIANQGVRALNAGEIETA